MAAKKNRVSIYGKTFHVIPASGRVEPLGAKQNWFTRCMSDGLKGNLNTGKGLSAAKLKANKDKFAAVKDACLLERKGAPKPRTRAPAKK